MQLNSIWDPYRRGEKPKIQVVQNGVNTEVFRSTRYLVSSIRTTNNKGVESWVRRNGVEKVKEVGITQEFSINELRSELGIPEGAKVIGKVAVFRSQKRLWLWVELALRILKKNGMTFISFLSVMGNGELDLKSK